MYTMIPVIADGSLTWMDFLLFVIAASFGWMWGTQFIHLMLMSEIDFSNRYDKYIWGAAFVFVFPFAPFAFWGWKSAMVEKNLVRDITHVRTVPDEAKRVTTPT